MGEIEIYLLEFSCCLVVRLKLKQSFRFILIHLTLYGMLAHAEGPTYDVVMAGKNCSDSSIAQTLSCNYVVGKSLRFSIDGIGDADTGITFHRSDIKGDYFATYGVLHGCVVVKPGGSNEIDISLHRKWYAFVSPKNGKVYRSWQECQEAL
jgi:hypothetical protein